MRSLILSLCLLLELFLSLLHIDMVNMPWELLMGRLFHSEVARFSVALSLHVSVKIKKQHNEQSVQSVIYSHIYIIATMFRNNKTDVTIRK